MTSQDKTTLLKLALPKGRMHDAVIALLADAGIKVTIGGRGYRPVISLDGVTTKILKPQNIVEMLHIGSRDLGFAGADWVAEKQAKLVELVDTELNPVRIVAAMPKRWVSDGLPERPILIASEYERLTTEWIQKKGLNATFVRSYGATEVFPPEDADCIVDNTATGATLRENGLEIYDEVMRSSTRMYAHPRALDDPARRDVIERIQMLVNSVLAARRRVMVEVNVNPDGLDNVVGVLPSLRQPTISPLHGQSGYAVKAAVPREELARIIPEIKKRGGHGIVITELTQIVP